MHRQMVKQAINKEIEKRRMIFTESNVLTPESNRIPVWR
jgi:hypothetical protein